MSTTITGIVINGVVVPSSPLPEGTRVEIHPQPARPEVPPELQEEFDDWERAGAGTVDDRLAGLVVRVADRNDAYRGM